MGQEIRSFFNGDEGNLGGGMSYIVLSDVAWFDSVITEMS